jgi:hypothetical protein
MSERIASCTCGSLRLVCSGKPVRISMCHCLDCQRRTGSAFSIAAFFARDAVRLAQGIPREFTRDSATGKKVTFHFCADCGSTVFWHPERMPHLAGVAVGAFADPSFPRPEQSVWTRDKHDWLELPEGMRRFDAQPPPRPVS